MARQHTTRSTLVRRLRPSPARFAAAAALHDPGLLLRLQAAKALAPRPIGTPGSHVPSTGLRWGS